MASGDWPLWAFPQTGVPLFPGSLAYQVQCPVGLSGVLLVAY